MAINWNDVQYQGSKITKTYNFSPTPTKPDVQTPVVNPSIPKTSYLGEIKTPVITKPGVQAQVKPQEKPLIDINSSEAWGGGRTFEGLYSKMKIPEYDITQKFDRLKAVYRLSDLGYELARHRSFQMDGKENMYDDLKKAYDSMIKKYPGLEKSAEFEEAKKRIMMPNSSYLGSLAGKEFESAKGNDGKLGYRAVEEFTKMAPMTLKTAGAGISAGTAGFVAGSVAGPTVGAWGAKIAGSAAAAKVAYDIERGSAYDEMISEGLPEDLAKKWSTLVGMVNAGIEVAEIATLAKTIPGAREFLSKNLKEGAKKIASGGVVTYLKTIGIESAQEVAQETTNILATHYAKKEAGMDTKVFTKDNFDRLVETAKSTALAMSVMALPGSVMTGASNMNAKASQAKMEKKVVELDGFVDDVLHDTTLDLSEQLEKFVFIKAVLDRIGTPEAKKISAKIEQIAEQHVAREMDEDQGFDVQPNEAFPKKAKEENRLKLDEVKRQQDFDKKNADFKQEYGEYKEIEDEMTQPYRDRAWFEAEYAKAMEEVEATIKEVDSQKAMDYLDKFDDETVDAWQEEQNRFAQNTRSEATQTAKGEEKAVKGIISPVDEKTAENDSQNVVEMAEESKSEAIKPTEIIEDVDEYSLTIEPVNEIEPGKVKKIADSMKKDEWKGEPLLAINTGPLQLLTGSHRFEAARQNNIPIPIYEIDAEAFSEHLQEEHDMTFQDFEHLDDEFKADYFKGFDETAQKIMDAETEHWNWEESKAPPKTEKKVESVREEKTEEMTEKKEEKQLVIGNTTITPNDVDYEFAKNAYSGISFDAEKRAKSVQESYFNELKETYDELSAIAETDEQKAILTEMFQEYSKRYLDKFKAYLGAKSRTLSPMITGPANFPVARNNKRMETESKRRDEFLDYAKNQPKRIKKAMLKESGQDYIVETAWGKIKDNIDTIKSIDAGEAHYHRSAFTTSITGMLKRMHDNGQGKEVNILLNRIKEAQSDMKKPILADRNSVWQLENKETLAEKRAPEIAEKSFDNGNISINDNNKLVLELDRDYYKTLPEDMKKEIKSNFLFSGKQKAWVSRGQWQKLKWKYEKILDKLGMSFSETEEAIAATEQKNEEAVDEAIGETIDTATKELDSIKAEIDAITKEAEEESDMVLRMNLQLFAKQLLKKHQALLKDLEAKKVKKSSVKEVKSLISKVDDLKAQIKEERSKFKEQKKADTEKRRLSTKRKRLEVDLLKRLRKLNKMKNKLGPKYKQMALELLGEVDTNARNMRKADRIKTEKFIEWFDAVKEEDPNAMIPESMRTKVQRLEKKFIGEMTDEEIGDLTDAVKFILHMDKLKKQLVGKNKMRELSVVKDAILKIWQTAENDLKDIGSDVKETNRRKKGIEIIKYTLTTGSLDLETEALRLFGFDENHPAMKYFHDDMVEGQRRWLKYKQDVRAYMDKHLKGIDLDKYQGDKAKKQTIKISDGRTITLTLGEKLSIIMHSFNSDNVAHIIEGGIRSKDWETSHTLTDEDIKTIVAAATDEEMKIVRVTQHIFDVIQKEAINEISNILLGYDVAIVKDYMRIVTDKEYRDKNFHKFANWMTLEGMGFLKEREGGKNAIMLENLFDVLNSSTDMIGKYYGYAVPLRNLKMILGNTEVRNALKHTFSNDDVKYFDTLIKQTEGNTRIEEKLERGGRKLLGRTQKSILDWGVWIWFKQLASFATASAEIESKYLAGAVGKIADWTLMEKHSPLLWYRRQGYVTRETGDVAKMYDKKKKSGWGTKGIQFFDSLAISHIWLGVEAETKATTNLKPGTDEYYDHVARRTEQIIYRTQPNYTSMQRSEIGRSESLFVKTFTLFATQTNKNYNIVYRAVKTMKKNPVKSSKQIGAVLAGNLMVAMISIGRSDWRDYEDSLWKQFASSMFGSVYFLRDMANIVLMGYKSGNLLEESVYDLVNSTSELLDFDSKKTAIGKMVDVTFALSAVSGVGVKNVEKEIATALKRFAPSAYYDYRRMMKEPTKTEMYSHAFTNPDDEKTIEDMKKAGVTMQGLSSSASAKNRDADPANDVSDETLFALMEKLEKAGVEPTNKYSSLKQLLNEGIDKDVLFNAIEKCDTVSLKMERIKMLKEMKVPTKIAVKILNVYYNYKM